MGSVSQSPPWGAAAQSSGSPSLSAETEGFGEDLLGEGNSKITDNHFLGLMKAFHVHLFTTHSFSSSHLLGPLLHAQC